MSVFGDEQLKYTTMNTVSPHPSGGVVGRHTRIGLRISAVKVSNCRRATEVSTYSWPPAKVGCCREIYWVIGGIALEYSQDLCKC